MQGAFNSQKPIETLQLYLQDIKILRLFSYIILFEILNRNI